jgi:glycerol-3-phosphate dehydrogenase (NAD(P)+)
MQKPILVIGAGSWGTALAMVLVGNGHPVYLWGRDSSHIAELKAEGFNRRYLPDTKFPEGLLPVDDLASCLRECDEIVLAVPCAGMRSILEIIDKQGNDSLKLCLTSKGLEATTHYLNHKVVEDCLRDKATTVVLSGPSFAKEVAAGLPTAVTIAGSDLGTAAWFAEKFHNEIFRTYTHDDVIGVEVGGAVKNVMAIAAGISDGLGFGSNTRAALITRGLAEIIRLGVVMGGRQETFMGLTGLGDLILTCTDDQSRNRRFGLELARGATILEACENIGQAIEGIKTSQEVFQLALKNNIEMPITEQVCKVVSGEVLPSDAVKALLMREQRQELD